MSPAGRPRRPAHRRAIAAADRRPRGRGRALGAVRRLDRPPDGWREATLPPGRPGAEDVAFAAASWALCVEYADDLNAARRQGTTWRPPPPCRARSSMRAAPSRRTCGSATRASTSGRPTRRRRCSPMRSSRPRPRTSAPIDTFRFEEDKVLRAALAALGDAAYDQAAAWADPRVAPGPTRRVVLAPRRPRAAVRLAARPRRGPPRAGDRPRGRRGLGADPAADDPWRRPSPPIPSAVPPSTRRTGYWSRRRAALLYPLLPEFEIAAGVPRRDARSPGATWADGWARGVQRALHGARLPAGRRAPAADALRRGGPAAGRRARDDRVLRRRRPPVRDGRGAVPADGRHPGDHRDAAAPARRAPHRDGGGDERARARRPQRPPAGRAGGRHGRGPGLPGG